MKYNNLVLLVLSAILLLIVGCVEPGFMNSGNALTDKIDDQTSNKFLVHEDTAYKVKILYPREWKLVETKDNIFAFQEPKLTAADIIQENLNLIMNDVSGQGITFEKFKDLAMENLKQTVQDFSLIESSSTTLAGNPAQQNIFTAFAPKLKLLQVITLKDDITYAITFISTPEAFESYLPTVQKMLDSFEITGDIKEQEEKEPANKEPEKTEVKKEDQEVKPLSTDLIKKDVSQNMAGTYRCWSYNVQGAGKSCTSPLIVLNKDSSYSMSSEKGTYKVEGDTIILSESKLRGPGKILEDGNQIRFEYDYNNWHHTMTYLKIDWVPQQKDETTTDKTNYIEVSLNIIFPESQGVSGINSVSLIAKSEKNLTGEAIAYESKPHTVTALFRKLATKPGIPTGKIYTVQVSTGFGYWEVGEIDLRNVTEDVELNVYAKTADETKTAENTQSTDNTQAAPVNQQKPAEPSPPPQEQPAADAPKCDPNIPKYSQPGCVE